MDHSEIKHLPKIDHTPAELDEESVLLLKAADEIERRGWCQNDYASDNGLLCILGALRVARGVDSRARTGDMVIERAAERLYYSLNRKFAFVWNDEPGRTQQEVVAKLRAVALGG